VKLVETLIAAVIAFWLLWALVAGVDSMASTANRLDARVAGRTSVDRALDRFASDAASAWSIFVPANDVLGDANNDGHEFDLASEDASHHRYWWAYRFDAASSQIVRYAYVPGSTPVAGDVFGGITELTATAHPITDLTAAGSGIADPLFAGATLTPVSITLPSGMVAGNGLVNVTIAAAGTTRSILLATATAPTHVTVEIPYTPAPPAPTP
jgi:hypothetical protein